MIPEEYRESLQYADYQKEQADLRAKRQETLIFCEHPPTITGGVQWKAQNLRQQPDELEKNGIPLVPIKRGGDLTAHEPGQLVIYPHIDLKRRKIPLSDYFHALLSISAQAVEDYCSVALEMRRDYPGLYFGERKVAAIGIEARSFFTSSGIAINVSNDLSTFAHIVACGLRQFVPGTLSQITSDTLSPRTLAEHWSKRFQAFLDPSLSHTSDIRLIESN